MSSIVHPGFEAFRSTHDAGRAQVVWTTLIADLETPVSAMLKFGADEPYTFLFESVQGGEWRGRYSIIGLKPDLVWRCRDGKVEINRDAERHADAFVAEPIAALASLRQLIRESELDLPHSLPPPASGVFGYLGYDMVRLMETLPEPNPDSLGLPDAILMRPTITAIFDTVRDEITVVTTVRPRPGIDATRAYTAAKARLDDIVARLNRPLPPQGVDDATPVLADQVESNTSHAEYLEMVARAKEYIRAGDVFQVVPSQRFRLPFALPSIALYRSLRRLNPSPFMYHLNFPGFSIVGSSPEILVRLRDGKVTIRPIAGTARRGATPEEDAALGAALIADPKERAEHLMLLDLGRNDVGRVVRTGSVKVTEQFVVERYSHVMHIVSNVEGEIDPRHDALDALAAGFPAGTLSGAPKVRAMEIIDELEKERRGIYAGAVGYFSANGSMDTCIVLRTAVLKDGVMYVQAGGGVVADSDPEAEFQETVNKSKALIRAAEEAVLFASSARRNRGD